MSTWKPMNMSFTLQLQVGEPSLTYLQKPGVVTDFLDTWALSECCDHLMPASELYLYVQYYRCISRLVGWRCSAGTACTMSSGWNQDYLKLSAMIGMPSTKYTPSSNYCKFRGFNWFGNLRQIEARSSVIQTACRVQCRLLCWALCWCFCTTESRLIDSGNWSFLNGFGWVLVVKYCKEGSRMVTLRLCKRLLSRGIEHGSFQLTVSNNSVD